MTKAAQMVQNTRRVRSDNNIRSHKCSWKNKFGRLTLFCQGWCWCINVETPTEKIKKLLPEEFNQEIIICCYLLIHLKKCVVSNSNYWLRIEYISLMCCLPVSHDL